MLCRRLGAAGLYGKPQERKGPGKRVRAGAGEGARLRWPEGALPAAPASGWARPGWRRPWRKLLFPFPLPPFPPRVTGRTVWERPRSSRLLNAGWGRAGQPVRLEGKPKVRLFVLPRHAVPRGGPCAPQPRPQLLTPNPPRFLQGDRGPALHRARRVGKCYDFFLCPAPVPTSSFLGFAASAGEGLIRFASKGCIYSVLLREARKHPGRPGRRDEGGG